MAPLVVKTLSNGFSMPVYGMGTWEMGGREIADLANDDTADVAALKLAMEEGITHIDTAESYAAGRAEQLVGVAIKNVPRENLFLVSKVSAGNHDAASLRKSFEASCRRLGTDYLDMYMLHRFDSSVLIDETMGAMNELVSQGLLKHIAVSNFNTERFALAQAASPRKIVANQLHYNVQVREAERDGILQYCQTNDVMVIAWGAVQKGALSLDNPLVESLRDKYRCTPTQLALSWLVSQVNVVTLSKTRDPLHMRENLDGVSLKMDANDVELIRAEMPNQIERSDRVPLDYE